MAWKYMTSIGTLFIKKINSANYGVFFNDEVGDQDPDPHLLADNVYMFCCGCTSWDLLAGKVTPPADLSYWTPC